MYIYLYIYISIYIYNYIHTYIHMYTHMHNARQPHIYMSLWQPSPPSYLRMSLGTHVGVMVHK